MSQTSTILIVDDEPAIREALEDLLTLQGYNLAFAGNGPDALKKAVQSNPDLILLDVMMPDLDGYEVCRRLRAHPQLSKVPIVMLTALADSESRVRGIEAGADEFLSKPFDPVELLARVRTITELNRYRRLLDERAKFERVIELSPNGILIVDGRGGIFLASPATHQILGIQAQQGLVGQNLYCFVAPDQREHCRSFLNRAVANPSTATATETSFLHPNTGSFEVEIDAGYFEWDGTPAVQIVFRDITERKHAEKQIQHQVQRLTTLRNIDLAITASIDLGTTLNAFLEQITKQLHLDAASILLLNPKAQAMEYAAGQGFRGKAITTSRLRLGEGSGATFALPSQIVSIPNLQKTREGLMRARGLENEGFVSYYAAPLANMGHVKGVLEIFNRTPLEPDPEWLEFLEALATQAVIAIEKAELFDSLQRTHTELYQAYDATLEGWSKALGLRDKETKEHTLRVTDMTVRLGRALGLKQEELVHLRRGALLHDIGKMGIPDGILLKPGPLTDAEEEMMRKHPAFAYEMLSPITYLRPAIDIPYCHHERWDGSGYPCGLKEQEIPLAARIFAVVDVWDALLSDRPYRPAWPEEAVRAYIHDQASKLFDPQIVAVFLEIDWT